MAYHWSGNEPFPEPELYLFQFFYLLALQNYTFYNLLIYDIEKKLLKSTCPTGSFTCPRPLGSGICQSSDRLVSWCIYASLGFDELILNHQYQHLGVYSMVDTHVFVTFIKFYQMRFLLHHNVVCYSRKFYCSGNLFHVNSKILIKKIINIKSSWVICPHCT